MNDWSGMTTSILACDPSTLCLSRHRTLFSSIYPSLYLYLIHSYIRPHTYTHIHTHTLTFTHTCSQRHPEVGVCPSRPLSWKELWYDHLTMGRHHGCPRALHHRQSSTGRLSIVISVPVSFVDPSAYPIFPLSSIIACLIAL